MKCMVAVCIFLTLCCGICRRCRSDLILYHSNRWRNYFAKLRWQILTRKLITYPR